MKRITIFFFHLSLQGCFRIINNYFFSLFVLKMGTNNSSTNNTPVDNPYKALVLEGGGAKGFSYNGLILGLDQYHILDDITHFGGTSIGALFALVLALGYKSVEVNEFILATNFSSLVSKSVESGSLILEIAAIPLTLYNFGMCKNDKVVSLVKEVIQKKISSIDPASLTFSQLQQITGKFLLVTSTNLNRQRVFYFSPDRTPDFPVYEEVCRSMNYPGVFEPILGSEGDYWVDGGVGDNFPLKEMSKYFPLQNILGAQLIAPGDTDDNTETLYNGRMEIKNDLQYLEAIINTMMVSRQNCDLYKDFWDNNIPLNVEKITVFDLSFTREQKEKIREDALTSTRAFIMKKFNLQ